MKAVLALNFALGSQAEELLFNSLLAVSVHCHGLRYRPLQAGGYEFYFENAQEFFDGNLVNQIKDLLPAGVSLLRASPTFSFPKNTETFINLLTRRINALDLAADKKQFFHRLAAKCQQEQNKYERALWQQSLLRLVRTKLEQAPIQARACLMGLSEARGFDPRRNPGVTGLQRPELNAQQIVTEAEQELAQPVRAEVMPDFAAVAAAANEPSLARELIAVEQRLIDFFRKIDDPELALGEVDGSAELSTREQVNISPMKKIRFDDLNTRMELIIEVTPEMVAELREQLASFPPMVREALASSFLRRDMQFLSQHILRVGNISEVRLIPGQKGILSGESNACSLLPRMINRAQFEPEKFMTVVRQILLSISGDYICRNMAVDNLQGCVKFKLEFPQEVIVAGGGLDACVRKICDIERSWDICKTHGARLQVGHDNGKCISVIVLGVNVAPTDESRRLLLNLFMMKLNEKSLSDCRIVGMFIENGVGKEFSYRGHTFNLLTRAATLRELGVTKESIPPELLCRLSGEIMNIPCSLRQTPGVYYDLNVLLCWMLSQEKPKCPVTKQDVSIREGSSDIVESASLLRSVETFHSSVLARPRNPEASAAPAPQPGAPVVQASESGHLLWNVAAAAAVAAVAAATARTFSAEK